MFKDLDRTSIIIIALCIVLIFSWSYIFGPKGLNMIPDSQQSSQKREKPEVQTEKPSTAVEPLNAPRNTATSIANLPLETAAHSKSDYKNVILTNPQSLIEVEVNPNEGAIASILLRDSLDANQKNKVVLNNNITPGALAFTGGQNEWILKKVYAPIVKKDNTHELIVKRKFEDQSGNSFLIEQDWKLEAAYTINYTVTVYNLEKKSIKFPEFYVWAGGIPPIEYLSGDVARSEAHRVDMLSAENNQISSLKVDDKKFPNNQEIVVPVRWLSISNKYFANILKPLSNDGNFYGGVYTSKKEESVIINGTKKEYFLASAAGIIKNVNLNAETNAAWNFKYYAGPKDIKLIGAFAPYAKDIMHLAFMSLESIAQWLLYFLIFLKGIVGNYGWAIILLTVIVKLVFWPITHKSNVSMKKMQKIQPMVKELREKYKDDKQTVNTKMMELYKKEGVNPLGGCLPILVQIPVFFALYWTLDGAIELRHTSFLWAKDLTQPDTIGNIFGLPINPLAIAMSLTMVLQQKLTPTATDPMQAKMMMLMPVIMLVFLYNLPSGLTLYWTVSQIISIIQLMVNVYNDKKEKSKTNLKSA